MNVRSPCVFIVVNEIVLGDLFILLMYILLELLRETL